MKKLLLFFAFVGCGLASHGQQSKTYRVTSPDGRLQAEISVGQTLTYRIEAPNETILAPSPLGMTLADGTVWGRDVRGVKTQRRAINETIRSPFYKKSTVQNICNQLTLSFDGGYAVEMRAYNDGIAYRFVYLDNQPITVQSDQAAFCFTADHRAFVSYVRGDSNDAQTFTRQFANSFENIYTHENLSELDPKRLIFTPIVAQLPSGRSVCIAEANLESYPGMFLHGDGTTTLHGICAPYPKTTGWSEPDRRKHLVTSAEDYIARVDGRRTFPWRAVIVAEKDCELTNSDMVYKLADPCRLDDVSWIQPGKVAWEWWNNWGVYGVDFKAGVNNDTYKYYIDFASENGIEYIILDEGWSVPKEADLFRIVPEIDLQELIDYGAGKNVGLILWAGYAAMANDIDRVCSHFAKMGIKGFKVDFMDRDDQPLVDFIYHVARSAAENKLLVDFHGMYKPTGLHRTYPNVINFEGVFGLENAKWVPYGKVDLVVYDVTIPFIRQVAGPMDYTQGAMLNANRQVYRPINSEPMSLGTRCRQLAEYVIFESPLNMLCDSPVKYRREPECTKFIAEIPTVWDETVALDGKIAQYVTMARRSGDTWYVGGMTDWDARTMTIDLSMLAPGSYQVELFRDGDNAERYAQDYRREIIPLPADRKFTVEMAPGGGFAAVITKN